MKVHSKGTNISKDSIKKQSAQTIDNIINDYNNIKSEGNNNNIFVWRNLEDSVICKAYNEFKPGKKLLSFDLDDTLISFEKKKSGKSKSPEKEKETSYIFTFDKNKIQSKLDEYQKKGFIFAIFSNQNGITQGHIKEKDFKNKVDKLFTELKYPFVIICAKEKDFFRKPCTGMIEIFKKYFNENLELELNECIFIGDAAGRKKSKTYKKNDFSDSDHKFAINCNFKFFTPEEFFLNEKSNYPKITNKLYDYEKNNNDHIKFDESPNFKEAIILVGSPGSGKSTFAENYLVPKGYVRINQDNLKTKQKVIKCLMQNIDEGKKIVIDCTNPQKNGRSEYIKICKEKNYPIRAFVFQVSKELAMHLNNLRAINKNRKHYSEPVNNIPIHTFFKNFEQPEITEGFKEIVQVNFVPGPFENEEDKKIFYYLS